MQGHGCSGNDDYDEPCHKYGVHTADTVSCVCVPTEFNTIHDLFQQKCCGGLPLTATNTAYEHPCPFFIPTVVTACVNLDTAFSPMGDTH